MSIAVGNSASASNPVYQQLKSTTAGSAAKGYDQNQYLEELNRRVKAPVIAGAWNGKSPFGSARPTVMVNPAMLKRMHDDPQAGAYYESQINIFAEEAQRIIQQEEAKGNTVTAMGMYIDENGEMSGFMSGTMKGGSESESSGKKVKSVKELMKELQERLMEKKAEEKLEEKRETRQQLLESLTAAGAVAVTEPAETARPDSPPTDNP